MKGLSKSRYTAFCQCPRMLWLSVYRPKLVPVDTSLQARFARGNEVGHLAMTIYPAIASMEPEEGATARKSLLEYCCLDTLAMVRIYQRLRELAKPD